MRPPIELFIFTDRLLFDLRLSSAVKIWLAAFNANPVTHRPTRRKLCKTLACFDHDTFRDCRRFVATQKLAWVDSSRCSHGEPLRLWRVAGFADPSRNEKTKILVPTAPVRNLKGRGAREAILLFTFYCREQLIRKGAVQVDDTSAADQLGWSRKTVERARKRLEGCKAIERQQDGAGRHGAIIYTVPSAYAEPNLDPADGFNPERTRSLRVVTLGEDLAATIYASAAERSVIELRASWADETLVQRLHDEAAAAAATIDRPCLHAKRDVLDGLLARVRPPARGGKSSVDGFPDTVEDGFPDTVQDGLPDSNCSSLSSLVPLVYDAPRREGEDEGSPDADATGEAHQSEGRTRSEKQAGWAETRIGASTDFAAEASTWPPLIREKTAEVFGEKALTAGTKTHALLAAAIGHTLRQLDASHGPLTEKVSAYVESQLIAALDYLAAQDDAARWRLLTSGRPFLRLLTDEETRERLKQLDRDRIPEPEAGTIDVRAELADLLAHTAEWERREPEQPNPVRVAVCGDCGIGGGLHALDCPTVSSGAA